MEQIEQRQFLEPELEQGVLVTKLFIFFITKVTQEILENRELQELQKFIIDEFEKKELGIQQFTAKASPETSERVRIKVKDLLFYEHPLADPLKFSNYVGNTKYREKSVAVEIYWEGFLILTLCLAKNSYRKGLSLSYSNWGKGEFGTISFESKRALEEIIWSMNQDMKYQYRLLKSAKAAEPTKW